MFAFGLPVCKQLQKERIDLKHTINIIETLLQYLKEIRENAEKEFQILFEKVKVSNLSFN